MVGPAPPLGLPVGLLVRVHVPEPGLLRGRPPRPPHPRLVFLAGAADAFVFVVVLALREIGLGMKYIHATWLILGKSFYHFTGNDKGD